MKIEYTGFRSELQRLEVEALVEKNKRILDNWVETLFVISWDTQEDLSCLASIESIPKYLQANLNIYNFFFANTEDTKERTIVHEFLHTHIGKIRKLVISDIIEYIREQNKDLSIYMQRSYCDAEEEIVEHFTNFLMEVRCGSKWN